MHNDASRTTFRFFLISTSVNERSTKLLSQFYGYRKMCRSDTAKGFLSTAARMAARRRRICMYAEWNCEAGLDRGAEMTISSTLNSSLVSLPASCISHSSNEQIELYCNCPLRSWRCRSLELRPRSVPDSARNWSENVGACLSSGFAARDDDERKLDVVYKLSTNQAIS